MLNESIMSKVPFFLDFSPTCVPSFVLLDSFSHVSLQGLSEWDEIRSIFKLFCLDF